MIVSFYLPKLIVSVDLTYLLHFFPQNFFSYFITFENVEKNLPKMPSLICLFILSYINNKPLIVNIIAKYFLLISKLNIFLRNGQCVRIYPLFCNFSQPVVICCASEHIKPTDI